MMKAKRPSSSILTQPTIIVAAVVSILVTFLTVAACFILLTPLNEVIEAHPSSEELINNFYTHRAEFDRLLQMAIEDQELNRVAYNFTRPEDPELIGITQERLNEYRLLFHKLNLEAGIENHNYRVWFIASSSGLSISGSAKGYIYTEVHPDLVVEDLDSYDSADGRSFTAYQQIKGNWYLYYDYED